MAIATANRVAAAWAALRTLAGSDHTDMDPRERVDELFSIAAELEIDTSIDACLKRLAAYSEAVVMIDSESIKATDRRKLAISLATELIENIVELHGVNWSLLRSLIKFFAASSSFLEGDFHRALIYASSALNLNEAESLPYYDRLSRLTILCHARVANFDQALEVAEQVSASDQTDSVGCLILSAELQRVIGRFSDCAETLMQAFEKSHANSDNLALIEWQLALLESQISLDPRIITSSVRNSQSTRNYFNQIEASLWAFALNSTDLLKNVMRPDSIRKTLKSSVMDKARLNLFDRSFGALAILHQSIGPNVPASERESKLEELLLLSKQVHSMEHELLIKIAVWHLAIEWEFDAIATMALDSYTDLSHQMSGGSVDDILGIRRPWKIASGDGVVSASARESLPIALSGQNKVVSRPAARALRLGKVVVKIANLVIRSKLENRFLRNSSASDKRRMAMMNQLTEYMISNFGALKGPIMKLAQMGNLMGFDLPDAISQRLLDIYDRTPAVSNATIKAIIESELKQPLEAIFSEWDENPIAAASIAQVHRARLRNGEEVAVKVRYPGLIEAVESDIRMISWIIPLLKLIFTNIDIKAHIEVNLKHLMEEVDFRREAEKMSQFATIFRGSKDFVIPEPKLRYTTSSVLVMDFLDGESLGGFLRTAGEERRAIAGHLILKRVFEAYLVHGWVAPDCHPGNFLFFRDGRVGMIDFGMCIQINAEKLASYRNVIACAHWGDMEAFVEAIRRVGYEAEDHDMGDRSFLSLVRELIVSHSGRDDHGITFNKDYLFKLNQMMGPEGHGQLKSGLNPDEFFFPRFWTTLASTLKLLGVRQGIDLSELLAPEKSALETSKTKSISAASG